MQIVTRAENYFLAMLRSNSEKYEYATQNALLTIKVEQFTNFVHSRCEIINDFLTNCILSVVHIFFSFILIFDDCVQLYP